MFLSKSTFEQNHVQEYLISSQHSCFELRLTSSHVSSTCRHCRMVYKPLPEYRDACERSLVFCPNIWALYPDYTVSLYCYMMNRDDNMIKSNCLRSLGSPMPKVFYNHRFPCLFDSQVHVYLHVTFSYRH